PQIQPRPGVARLDERPPARRHRRHRRGARLQGRAHVGPDGQRARHRPGLQGREGRRRSQPAADQGWRPRRQGRPRAGPPVDQAGQGQGPRRQADGKEGLMAETKTRKPAARKQAQKKEVDHLHAPFFDSAGERQGDFELPKVIFAETPNMGVMHQAYVRQMANARQGNASTKTRATVSGGGAKPYRQKGTGRARHGSTREPSMKGGAVVFGPRPRSYEQRMPKQMRRLALRSALTIKAQDNQVRVIEAFGFEEPKPSQAKTLTDAIGFDDTT